MGKIVGFDKEQTLLASLKNGDSQAFEQLYRDSFKMIDAYIQRNNGTPNDAQDIFQETLIVLVKNIRKPDFELRSKISTYVYSIATKMWLYRLRGNKGVNQISIEDAGEKDLGLEESDIIRKQEVEQKYTIIADKLAELGEECQKIITEFYNRGRELKELAEEMGYTYAFIRVKKNRCMNTYRKKVKSALPDND